MKIEADLSLGLAYVTLKNTKVKNSIRANRDVVLDYDRNGDLCGIELLSLNSVSTQVSGKMEPKTRGKVLELVKYYRKPRKRI